MFQSWSVIGLFNQMASGSFLHLWVDPAVRFLLTQFAALGFEIGGPRWLLYAFVFSFLGQPYKIAHWYFVKVFMINGPICPIKKKKTGQSEWVFGLGIWISRLVRINGLLNNKFGSSNLTSSGIYFQGCWAV